MFRYNIDLETLTDTRQLPGGCLLAQICVTLVVCVTELGEEHCFLKGCNEWINMMEARS